MGNIVSYSSSSIHIIREPDIVHIKTGLGVVLCNAYGMRIYRVVLRVEEPRQREMFGLIYFKGNKPLRLYL